MECFAVAQSIPANPTDRFEGGIDVAVAPWVDLAKIASEPAQGSRSTIIAACGEVSAAAYYGVSRVEEKAEAERPIACSCEVL